MRALTVFALFFLILASASHAAVPRLIQLLHPGYSSGGEDAELEYDGDVEKELLGIHYFDCESWRLGVEANSIINFKTVPSKCEEHVIDYVLNCQYRNDSKTVCKEAYFFAKGLALKNDTINVWIFDVDDTLLSNVPYFVTHGFGYAAQNSTLFERWVSKGISEALPESLHLYNNILKLGIKPVFLTERPEELRDITIANLRDAGYTSWEKIIFKPSGSEKKVVNFKSSQRKKLARSGYTIIGNIGDQWSDLQDSQGRHTFKFPNPMYYAN